MGQKTWTESCTWHYPDVEAVCEAGAGNSHAIALEEFIFGCETSPTHPAVLKSIEFYD